MKKTFTFIIAFFLYGYSYSQTTGALNYYTTTYITSHVLQAKSYGFIIPKNTVAPPQVAGTMNSDFVHIFIDEDGNPVSQSLPPGVPWVSYVIHVIHPLVANESYGVIQTSGGISGAFVIQNAPAAPAPGGPGVAVGAPAYTENIFVLSPSDNANIGFQVSKTVTTGGSSVKTTIGNYTLTISGYYNASINVGLINSQLHNPTYTLVPSPSTSGAMVVKKAGAGDRMMTTVMATIYFSPLAGIKRLVDRDNMPLFKVKGRSMAADHSLFERIYPAVGLSINENTFQNIFYGLNWELFRGASLFAGFHTGKINTYNNPSSGFAYGTTSVTQDQFNYQSDAKWATRFAFGATIDLRVVTGLLGTQIK